MMRNIADFTTRVLASLPRDTSNELVQLAVRDTINDFMRATRLFRDELHVPVDRCAAPLEFLFEVPDCRKIVEAISLWAAPGNCGTGRRDARWTQLCKAPSEFADGWWIITEGESNIAARVNDWHGGSSMVAMVYAYTIARDGCDVPDAMYEEWFDAVKFGARARIFNDPDSGAMNPRLAMLEQDKFDGKVAEARVRLRLNFGGGTPIDMHSVYCGAFGG